MKQSYVRFHRVLNVYVEAFIDLKLFMPDAWLNLLKIEILILMKSLVLLTLFYYHQNSNRKKLGLIKILIKY